MNKEKIAILVDSCTDLPKEIIEKYKMYVLPLKVIYQDQEFYDGVTITPQEVYEQLSVEVPKTSLPSGDDIIKLFDQIKSDGYEKVLAVTISSGLSGTNNFVELLASDYEDLEIRVIDTKNIGVGAGMIAFVAAQLVNDGVLFEDLVNRTKEQVKRSKVFFVVSTLEYLKKGGRIGLVSSVLGSALNLKPIISCNEDGIYYTVAKVRGRKQSLRKTIELAKEFAGDSKKYIIGLSHGNAYEELQEVRLTTLDELPNHIDVLEGQISPALGVHTGPGLIGIGVYKLD